MDEFIKHGLVALGGARLGKLDSSIKKDQVLKLYAEKYPEEKEGSRAVWASQLVRLITEIKTNDEVVTFDRDQRLYFIGTTTGEYEWAPTLIECRLPRSFTGGFSRCFVAPRGPDLAMGRPVVPAG